MHIPFCFHKCHYCDFFSLVDRHDRQAAFAARLMEELAALTPWVTQPLQTIFVGGGTPTLLAPPLWGRLLESLSHLPIAAGFEFTVEANPETVTPDLARTLAPGGVNRVSIGCQSFDPRHLKTLERWHDPANVATAMHMFHDAGVENINLDLIFAIPGQSLEDWRRELDQALALEPQHLSCYNLTYEPNTAITQRLRQGLIEPVESEVEAAMFTVAIDRLTAAGFEHYEISNFARPGCQCRHNLLYWRNQNWLAAGPSASGHIDGLRWKNAAALQRYLDGAGLSPITDVERVDASTRVGEALMMGLRLIQGMPVQQVEELLTHDLRADERRKTIARQVEAGMLQWRDDALRLTTDGLMFADEVIASLL